MKFIRQLAPWSPLSPDTRWMDITCGLFAQLYATFPVWFPESNFYELLEGERVRLAWAILLSASGLVVIVASFTFDFRLRIGANLLLLTQWFIIILLFALSKRLGPLLAEAAVFFLLTMLSCALTVRWSGQNQKLPPGKPADGPAREAKA